MSFCRTMPAIPNCFVETNVEEVVDFLSIKGYNLLYIIRHVSDWNESDSLALKQEIDHAIQRYLIKGLASNYIMYFHMRSAYSSFSKYIWYLRS